MHHQGSGTPPPSPICEAGASTSSRANASCVASSAIDGSPHMSKTVRYTLTNSAWYVARNPSSLLTPASSLISKSRALLQVDTIGRIGGDRCE